VCFGSNYFSENADIVDFLSKQPTNIQHQIQSAIKNPAYNCRQGFGFLTVYTLRVQVADCLTTVSTGYGFTA
jgi:hypothetical protein